MPAILVDYRAKKAIKQKPIVNAHAASPPHAARHNYSITTAVPLAETISIPFSRPITS
jgi:hypothetical protein